MTKFNWLSFIFIITCFLPAKAQSRLDGVYQGMEEMTWTDSMGIRHNAFLSQDSSKWYHENILVIRADSIFIGQSPVHIVSGQKLYSASTGSFYYYAGSILKKDSSLIVRMSLTSCGYCPQEVVSAIDEKTGEQTFIEVDATKRELIYTLIKTKKGLILNNVNYQRLSSRQIKKYRFL